MKICHFLVAIAFTSLGVITALKPPPVNAAERISFSLPFLGKFYISAESLAIFANEGRITSEFAYYAKHLSSEELQNFRQILQSNWEIDPITVYRLTNMPMGEDFLRRLGNIIYTHPQRNGIYAIRSALILAAAEPEGLTAINFLRHFPTAQMHLDIKSIDSLVKESESFLRYRDTTVKAIAKRAKTESSSQFLTDLKQLPNLYQPGKYRVKKQTITFTVNDVRQTPQGFLGEYELSAEIYLPQKLNSLAPLAIITHGLGSKPADFDYLAKHLASHGYIVAVPEHSGSSDRYKKAYFNGEVGVYISPIEFYSRPRDITHLLDRLEQHPDLQQRINWSQVGIIGHSLGGTTALITGGAPINLARLDRTCQQDRFTLNASVLLQCRARNLPPGQYNLQDTRIKAVMALNPIASSILGVESLEQIKIPTLMLGGTADYLAPFIEEQVHPFLWLTASDKYLATVVNGTHFSTLSQGNIAQISNFSSINDSPNADRDLGRKYLKTLSLAFLEAHTRDRLEYKSYLTAAYAKKISNPELPFHLIRSLTLEKLELAYGDTTPIPHINQIAIAKESLQKSNTLAEIKRTGVLKVAIRQDATPFGYKDKDGNLVGYCVDFTNELGDRLTEKLNTPNPIEIVTTPSLLSNRFELVKQGIVHFECGPNSIVSDRQEIVFSDPFFISGTRFLVKDNSSLVLDFNGSLKGIRLGVLDATTSKQFLERQYPDAEIVTYAGENDRKKGIQALKNGDIDAFVSDTVLLTGKLDRQNLNKNNYRTIPEKPLTCDYYGLILPKDDPQWRKAIDTFIRDLAKPTSETEFTTNKASNQWLKNYYSQAVTDLDYCQNRR